MPLTRYVLFEVWDKKALKDDLVGSARISTEELQVYADDAGQTGASSSTRPAKSVSDKVNIWPSRALLYLVASSRKGDVVSKTTW